MAFRCRADDGPLLVVHVFGSSSSHQHKKNVVRVGPPLRNFLDPRMYCFALNEFRSSPGMLNANIEGLSWNVLLHLAFI